MKFLYRHPIITSLFLTAILLAVAAVSGGVGHGNYTLAIVLFPYAGLAAVVLDHFFNATIPMILIATLQFPLYGAVISISRGKVSERTVVMALLAFHAIAASIAVLVVYY
jgi:hypothetical protein